MLESNPTKFHKPPVTKKLRVVHAVKTKDCQEDRSANISGEPGLTLQKPPAYNPKGYSTDAVPGNYQGL